jgi:regulator of sigma E protease
MLNSLVQNDLLSTIAAFILVLMPAVFIHELGHFLAAKAVGITILEFGLGLPPRMKKLFTYKGTDYTLNWLPLGGFVRPLGEDMVRQLGNEALEEDRSEAKARGIEKTTSVNEAKPLARIFFMAAGALSNFGMAIVLFIIVALIGIPQIVGGRVNVFYVTPDSELAKAGLQPKDLVEDINGQKFQDIPGFVSQLYAANGQPVTLTVRRFDPVPDGAEQTSHTFDLTFTPHLESNQPPAQGYVPVIDTAPNSPAVAAGIKPGDLIMAFEGQPVQTVEELQQKTQAHLGEEVTLTIWRAGQTLDIPLTPRQNPPQGQGSMGIILSSASGYVDNSLGLVYQDSFPQEVLVSQPLDKAIGYSFSTFANVLDTIVNIPMQVLRGTIAPDAARPVSIVGISQMGGQLLQQSVEENQPTKILNYIALISVALGFTNLLPIPALDGGRILFVLIEIVRGRPIAPEREGLVHLIGLALLLSAMVIFIVNDLVHPITNIMR